MVIVSGGSGGADCDVDSRKVVDSGREVGCRDAARSGCAMGLGGQGGQRAWVGRSVFAPDGHNSGSFGVGFLGGFIVPACWRGGPKSCDPGV